MDFFKDKILTIARSLNTRGSVDLVVLALVYRTLHDCKWCRSHASKKLLINPKTLRKHVNTLKKYGFVIPDYERELYGVKRKRNENC